MITKLEIDSRGLLVQSAKPLGEVKWIDVLAPSQEEYEQIEAALKIKVPLHHEMHQIEFSSRFYEENNALYLSAVVVTKVAPMPESHVITFIITQSQLISLRFSNPNPIKTFIDQLDRHSRCPKDHIDILIELLDSLVGRVADIFELFEEKTELMALGLKATMREGSKGNGNVLNETLHEINDLENVLSKCYQSLSSLQLLAGFYQHSHEKLFGVDITSRLISLKQDVKAMLSQGEFLTQKLEFQLETTLGLINIQQTHIIKTFTVLAMIFMPPTLVASIYGMNFKFMPELNLMIGYPLALVLMVISGLMPYLFFKRKGWL